MTAQQRRDIRLGFGLIARSPRAKMKPLNIAPTLPPQGTVAQSVEPPTLNRVVDGSKPSGPTNFKGGIFMTEPLTYSSPEDTKREVMEGINRVDWDTLENLLKPPTVPIGSFTSVDYQARYRIGHTKARNDLARLVVEGKLDVVTIKGTKHYSLKRPPNG